MRTTPMPWPTGSPMQRAGRASGHSRPRSAPRALVSGLRQHAATICVEQHLRDLRGHAEERFVVADGLVLAPLEHERPRAMKAFEHRPRVLLVDGHAQEALP